MTGIRKKNSCAWSGSGSRVSAPKHVKVKDTSDFFHVDYDDVVVLKGVPFFVRNKGESFFSY